MLFRSQGGSGSDLINLCKYPKGLSLFSTHMARAAAAVGIDALFLEVHDNPAEALSDGPNMVRLDNLKKLLSDVLAIDKIVRG